MQFHLLHTNSLSTIPSASGIEIVGNDIYVMGDDSPWLFRLDKKFEVKEKIPIGNVSAAVKGKTAKEQKPDLEAMIVYGNELLLLGSGSRSPQRDVLLSVDLISKKVRRYPLAEFYDALCAAAGFSRRDLNIEAAALIGERLFLFNRGKNRIAILDVQEFLTHVQHKGPLPEMEIVPVTLPLISGMQAGFSGACSTPDGSHLVFCASAENTSNWIDDGEILGSFIGAFSPAEIRDSFRPACVRITGENAETLSVKVESVAVQSASARKLSMLLVTDNDRSGSELIEAGLLL